MGTDDRVRKQGYRLYPASRPLGLALHALRKEEESHDRVAAGLVRAGGETRFGPEGATGSCRCWWWCVGEGRVFE